MVSLQNCSPITGHRRHPYGNRAWTHPLVIKSTCPRSLVHLTQTATLLPSSSSITIRSHQENHQQPMSFYVECSRPSVSRHDQLSRPNGRGHDLTSGLNAQDQTSAHLPIAASSEHASRPNHRRLACQSREVGLLRFAVFPATQPVRLPLARRAPSPPAAAGRYSVGLPSLQL
jgi:hypothetical protein